MQLTMASAPSAMHGGAHATDINQTAPERPRGRNHIGHHKKIYKTMVNSSLMGKTHVDDGRQRFVSVSPISLSSRRSNRHMDASGESPATFAPTRSLAGPPDGATAVLKRSSPSGATSNWNGPRFLVGLIVDPGMPGIALSGWPGMFVYSRRWFTTSL